MVAVVIQPPLKLKQISHILGHQSDLNFKFFGEVSYKIIQIDVFKMLMDKDYWKIVQECKIEPCMLYSISSCHFNAVHDYNPDPSLLSCLKAIQNMLNIIDLKFCE